MAEGRARKREVLVATEQDFAAYSPPADGIDPRARFCLHRRRPLGGEPEPDDAIDDLRWFSRGEQLPEMAFAADTHIIERYFANPEFGSPVDPRYARLI